MEEGDSSASTRVVKSGPLHVKRPPGSRWSGFKTWQQRYFVLTDETVSCSPCLDMYEAKKDLGSSRPRLRLELGPGTHVGCGVDSSSFPYALVLVCGGRSPLVLAAEDEPATRSWLLALTLLAGRPGGRRLSFPGPEADADAKHLAPTAFPDGPCDAWPIADPGDVSRCRLGSPLQVKVVPTEDARKFGIAGQVTLVVCRHGVGLAHGLRSERFVLWPVAYVRQFRHQDRCKGWWRSTVVTLEVGRRCSTGEGVFQFKTRKGSDLVLQLKRMVELWSAKKARRRHSLSGPEPGRPSGNADSCTEKRFGSAQHPLGQHPKSEVPEAERPADPSQPKTAKDARPFTAPVSNFRLSEAPGVSEKATTENETEDEGYIEVLSGDSSCNQERE